MEVAGVKNRKLNWLPLRSNANEYSLLSDRKRLLLLAEDNPIVLELTCLTRLTLSRYEDAPVTHFLTVCIYLSGVTSYTRILDIIISELLCMKIRVLSFL